MSDEAFSASNDVPKRTKFKIMLLQAFSGVMDRQRMNRSPNDMPSWLQRLFGRKPLEARAPENSCLYAVGDIHGRLDLLSRLVRQIIAHSKGVIEIKSLIFLGDYIDRGSDSKGVIDFLVALGQMLPGWEVVFLRGNHDQAILDFLADPAFYRAWREFGAQETLLSYGVFPPRFDDDAGFTKARDALAETIPQKHLKFFRGLQNSVTKGDYFFVHAGVRPGIALDDQTQEDMLWIREDFLLSNRSFGKVVVHGHTPTEGPVVRRNRIGIDTGAHATERLTAAVLRHDTCTFLVTESAAETAASPPL